MPISLNSKVLACVSVLVMSFILCYRLNEVQLQTAASRKLSKNSLLFNLTLNASQTDTGTEPTSSETANRDVHRLFDIGQAELQQLRQYERIVKDENYSSSYPKLSPSSYNFTVIDVDVSNHASLSFTVQQDRRRVSGTEESASLLIGGASFYVTVIGERHWTTCRTTDSFNGRYVVECPMYDTCVNVTATVYYADFGAFRLEELGLWAYSVFWSEFVCKANSNLSSNSITDFDMNYVGWTRTEALHSNWSWIDRGASVMSRGDLYQCVTSSRAPVTFLGDSHLRMVFYYLMDLFGALTAEQQKIKEREFKSFRHSEFIYGSTLSIQQSILFPTFLPSAMHILSDLQRENEQLSSDNGSMNNTATRMNDVTLSGDRTGVSNTGSSSDNSKAVNKSTGTGFQRFIVLSIGTWDVSVYNVHYFLNTFLPVMSNYTRDLQHAARIRGVKVIFVTMPACLHGPRPLHRSGPEGRNNPRLAALNRLLTETLTGQGITVVDYFAPTILRQAETGQDAFHYSSTPGSAGDTVARLVLQELCT